MTIEALQDQSMGRRGKDHQGLIGHREVDIEITEGLIDHLEVNRMNIEALLDYWDMA